jgi:hypothetical protein
MTLDRFDAELQDTQDAERAAREATRLRRTRPTAREKGDADLLASPEAQPLIARLGASCALFAADIDPVQHVKTVALYVLRGRARELNRGWSDR